MTSDATKRSIASTLERIRSKTAPSLVYAQFAHIPVLLVAGLAISSPNTFAAAFLSLVICVAGFVGLKLDQDGSAARNLITTGYILQAALFVFVFAGHPWQIDLHMYFYAALGMGAALFDRQAIIVGAVVTAVHHLILNFAMPIWVFPDYPSVARVLLHGFIIGCEAGILAWFTAQVTQYLGEADTGFAKARETARAAEEAQDAAIEAGREARVAEQAANEATKDARKALADASAAKKRAEEEALRAQKAEKNAAKSEQTLQEKTAHQSMVVELLADALRKLSMGDLTAQIDQEFDDDYDRLRQDFNNAMTRMRALVQDIVVKADAIRAGVNDLSLGANELSRRTDNQAKTLADAATALSNVTDTIQSTAASVGEAHSSVIDTENLAQSSSEVMEQATSAMHAIETSSGKIGKIISVIEDIASQTNLLALNAGVEASRAGDAGRGFAVVAQEVRALAQRSADAAKEIKELVDLSANQVTEGSELVRRTAKSLTKIDESIRQFGVLFKDIARASKSQTASLRDINTSVGSMDQMTQQNASMVQQSSSTTVEIGTDADQLARLTGQFRTKSAAEAAAEERAA